MTANYIRNDFSNMSEQTIHTIYFDLDWRRWKAVDDGDRVVDKPNRGYQWDSGVCGRK